ncbi:DUF1801 domain-containing protein [Flavobacterium sp. 102]|uniref:DUF1801 domain-containing protein n=1 Tax=Flavobacterium sp. 102 TaxID=2135623 RepID=UPI000EB3D1E1|nr:DUF1801 domain-containing protein [Flavobacterium sp. 102]RKS02270.1 hypothetical protein C8C84_1979 [Flavobacterium sp. 102]
MKPTELYILKQPAKYRDILLHIVAVVEHTLPEVTLEYKWGIPYFYYKKKPFCYLNASHKHQFVDVGFAKGFQLKNNQEYLIADKGRNTIKSLRYYNLEKIDNAILISVIEEAKALY